MISSKLRAYNYVNGEWVIVNRWELIKMPDVEYKKFKHLHFPLYLKRTKDSYRLTFNRRQKTFRFYPGELPDDKKGGHGLTISHQLAQEVISDLSVLHLRLSDKRTRPYQKIDFDIEVDQVFEEFRTTANSNEYIIDLLVVFSKPEWLALKWNRTLALEVYVTSDVRGKKIIDFEKKRVSLVEVSLGSKLLLRKNASEVSETEENKLRGIMQKAFSTQIFGDLLVDATSSAYLESKRIQQLESEIHSLKKFSENSQKKIDSLEIVEKEKRLEINILKSSLRGLKEGLQRRDQEILQLKRQIEMWETKSKLQRFIDLLRK